MSKALRGKFRPKHPEKYIGDPNGIIFRSLLERKCMVYFDNNPNVIGWGSEEMHVKYMSPIDNTEHRYFPDFVVKVRDKMDNIKTWCVEVKPHSQTMPPKPSKSKYYANSVETYAINVSKWKAAKAFCDQHGWHFMILTEKVINHQGRKI